MMNEQFVNIKVDREERPDLDQMYMNAVQAHDRARRMADDGVPHPAGRAFLRRTYFPPERRQGIRVFRAGAGSQSPRRGASAGADVD